jgi:plasmid maintenance system antidote protein VapI
MIDNTTKEQIRTHLIKFCEVSGSDNKAANKLGVSNAYVSKIKNNKSEALSDDMWRKIAKMLGLNLEEQWHFASTQPSNTLFHMFEDSRVYCSVYGIIVQPGSGKTYMLDRIRLSQPDVFFVKCVSEMQTRDLLIGILESMGKSQFASGSIVTLLRQIENEVERREYPTIIFDEPEKISNKALYQFIDIYNILKGKCGLILLGTPNLKTRIETNRKRLKIGYNEIFSRLGLKFIEIPAPDAKDAASVIRAQGITDQLTITEIINESIDDIHRGIDLRRVERLVHKFKINQQKAA